MRGVGEWRTTSDPVGRVAIDEIEGDAPFVEGLVLEAIATALHSRTRARNAWALAKAAGCRVVHSRDMPDGMDGILFSNGVIVLRERFDRVRMAMALLHEVAHWLLRRLAHSHGDVWLLALALGAPLPLVRRLARGRRLTPAQLCRHVTLPLWAAGARLDMATVRLAA